MIKSRYSTSIIVASSFVLMSCQEPQPKDEDSIQNEPKVIETEPLLYDGLDVESCAKKSIYYISDVDVSSYKNLDIQYFHRVMDYTNPEDIESEAELAKLDYYLEVDGTKFFNNSQMDSILQRVYTLKKDLASVKKEVVGYVFVHTFLSQEDTLSAIILANADGSKSEAIPIKAVTEIEPNHFKQQIREIEQ